MWFISQYAGRLQRDGLLDECREQIRALLAEQTREFVILPWDHAPGPEQGEKRDHFYDPQNICLVVDTLGPLLRFCTLGSWADEFLATLLTAREEPVKSAWFLALARAVSCCLLYQGSFGESTGPPIVETQTEPMPDLAVVWNEWERPAVGLEDPAEWTSESALIKYHADVILKSGDLFTMHPNYWEYLFRTLGLGCARTRFPFPTTYRADFCHEPEPAASARTRTTGTGQGIRLLTPCDQLIRDIEAAFCRVALGDGFTLHEGPAFEGNDYCTAEERASVRASDPETCWQDIPDASLWECAELWGFDEEGVRYHLPAYMRWHVRNPPGPNAPRSVFLYDQLTFTHQEGKRVFWELGWDIYTREQKRVIARFLEFIVREGGPFAHAARVAWQSYWHKFSQEAATE
jgi:hypothetical protein